MNAIEAGRARWARRENGRRAQRGRPILALLAFFFTALFARAAEVIPPAPQNHFNDYAGVIRRDVAQQLNGELAQFERDTSNQLVVAIFPKLQSDSSVEDYTVRVAQKWGVGQRDKKNGAVLFVFLESHDLRIVTGYGLEGVLPDARCKQIIENEIVPRFRANDFTGGAAAGARTMMAAVRGEYRGSGRTVAEVGRSSDGGMGVGIGFLIFMIILFALLRGNRRRSVVYGRGGRRNIWLGGPGPWGGSGWGGGGGGGWSGGGGGGGTFSGGGGSFGGGGAGGKW